MPSRRTLLVASAGFIGFVVVLVMVCTGTGIVRADHSLADALSRRHDWFSTFSTDLTDVVSPSVDAVALLILASILSWCRRRPWELLTAVWAEAILLVVILGLKYAVHRGSPFGYTTAKGEFPSGHTASALVLLGTGARLAFDGVARRRALAAVGTLAVLLAACLVWNRFHWLSDVVASFLLAPVLLLWVELTPFAALAEVRPRGSGRRSPS